MGWLKVMLVAYGLFLIASGVQGYMAGSKISLLAGGGAGILVLTSVALVGWRPAVGYGLAILVAIALVGRFRPVFIRSDDPMKAVWPALTMVVVSAGVAIALVAGHFLSKKA